MQADGFIDFRPNPEKRRQHRISGVAPQSDCSVDSVELQRANMFLVVVSASRTPVESV